MYRYQARVVNVVDGDTLDLTIDLGFKVRFDRRVRLRDVNTAEIHFVAQDSDEFHQGMEHKRFVEQWLAEAEQQYNGDDDWPLIVETEKHEMGTYGRYLAYIERKCDNDELTIALLGQYDDIAYE